MSAFARLDRSLHDIASGGLPRTTDRLVEINRRYDPTDLIPLT